MVLHEFIRYFYPILCAVLLLEVFLIQRNLQAIFSWKECLALFKIMIGHRLIGTMLGVIRTALQSPLPSSRPSWA